MPGSVRTILYAALLLDPQSLLSEGGLCSDDRFGSFACNSDEDCSPGICDLSTPSGNCASGCHAAAEGDPCFTDDECSRFRVSCECVYPEVVPPAASPTPPVNNPPPATPTTPTGGGVAPEDNPATPPLGPASNITGDDSTGMYVGIGVGATLLVCCIFCCLCVVFDWTGATRQQRRKKVGLPKTATDAECEYAERRQNLFISSTATEEECVAAEAKVAAERAERARKERDYEERETAWQKEMDRRYWIDHEEEMRLTGGLGYAERNRRRKAEREEREEGARALMATLYLPPGTTIPEPPRFDAARAMLVGLTGTATVEEVLRREERQHICGRWDASDEAFRHARGELDRARATAAAASDAAAAAREAMRKAKFDAEWAEKTAKDEREHQELMSNIAAKTAKDKAQRQEGRDWLEARAEARAAERDAATAKREATTQARKAERDAYMAKRDEVEAEARDAAAKEREQQFAEQKAPVVQKVAATFLVPEEQRLGEYHSSHDGTIYYKGERIDHGDVGGLEVFGGGYARNGDGTVWFHGKVVEGINARYNSFHVAGNGYALNEGVIVYAGKMVGLTTGVMETGLDHLGNGWSRTHDNTYLFRGEVVSTGAARTRCPHFAEVDEAAVKPVEGTEDNDFLVPEEQRLGEYHWGGIEGTIYYKSEEIGQSTGFEDFGDGYARNGEGQVWFHGKVMEGVNAQYDRFANAGNGYAVCQGVLYYAGKEIAADRVS